GVRERDQCERHDGYRENRVRDEKRKVDGANPALPAEADNSGMCVEIEITNQEDHRTGEGAEHAELVLKNLSRADEDIAEQQKQRARGVERRVDSGKFRERDERHSLKDAVAGTAVIFPALKVA